MLRIKEAIDKLLADFYHRLGELYGESRTKANEINAGSHTLPSLRSRIEFVIMHVTVIVTAVRIFVAKHPDLKHGILGTYPEEEAELELASRVQFSGDLPASCHTEMLEGVVEYTAKETALERKEMEFLNEVSGFLQQMSCIIQECMKENATRGIENNETGNITTENKNISMQAKSALAENTKPENRQIEKMIKRRKTENTKPEKAQSEGARSENTQSKYSLTLPTQITQIESMHTKMLLIEKEGKMKDFDSLYKCAKAIDLANDNTLYVTWPFLYNHFAKNRDSIMRCYRRIESLQEAMSASLPSSVAAVGLLADKVKTLDCQHQGFLDRFVKLHGYLMSSMFQLSNFFEDLIEKLQLMSKATTLEDVRSISFDKPDWWSSIPDIRPTIADWVDLTAKIDDCLNRLDSM